MQGETGHKKGGLSKHIERIGYHFISSVAERACKALNISASSLKPEKALSSLTRRVGHVLPRRGAGTGRNESVESEAQALLYSQARDHVSDLFPDIPAEDACRIVSRAFKKAGGA